MTEDEEYISRNAFLPYFVIQYQLLLVLQPQVWQPSSCKITIFHAGTPLATAHAAPE
jgi:hypothetical protein